MRQRFNQDKTETARLRLRPARGFTILELIVVIAIIGVLSALLLPAVSRAGSKAGRAICFNNAKQINLGLQMYATDNNESLPNTNSIMFAYKNLMRNYVGLKTDSPPRANERLFQCPADRFHVDAFENVAIRGGICRNMASEFSSYGFNGLNRLSDHLPGVAGMRLAAIHDPVKTLLLAEASGFTGFSWHNPQKPPIHNNARSIASFADGHVSYIRIFWNGFLGKTDSPMFYDPPAGYDYRWSAAPQL